MRIHYPLALALSLIVAACAAPPAAVAEAVHEKPRTITVTGIGEASAAPDMMILRIGVVAEGKTASTALKENSRKMSALIDTLKGAGVESRDIQTSGLSINPQYDYSANRSKPRLVGYQASNGVTVRLRDLENAGAVLDDAVSAGANTLNGVSFGFADTQPLQDKARRNAVANAKAKAKLLTDEAGVGLGEVMEIRESGGSSPRPQPMMMEARMASDSVAAPIEAGESSISARVTIVYRLK